MNRKVHESDGKIFISAQAQIEVEEEESKRHESTMLFQSIDVQGNIIWERDIPLPEYLLNPDDNDPLITPISMTSSVGLEYPQPYQLLRRVVASRPSPKHGVQTQLFTTPDFFVYWGKNFIIVLDIKTGAELASYGFRYGVLLSVEGEKLLLDYISDYFGQTRASLDSADERRKRVMRYDVVG